MAKTISTKLVLDGEAEYKAKVKSINAELGLHKTELEKVQAKYKDSANSLEALSAKQSALNGAIKALNRKHSEQAAMLEKAREAQQKFANEAEELKGKLDALANSSGATAEEQKNLADDLAEAKEKMKRAEAMAVSYQKQINLTERDQCKLGDELKRTQQYLDEARASADGCATSIDKYGKEVKQAGQGIQQLAAALAAAGVAKTVKEITEELLACSNAAAGFETAMAKVSTLAGPGNLEGIKAQLVELSNETGVAVGSLAEAAYQAMSAGVDSADAVNFVATATKTSIAGFTDSATAVDLLTTALNAYHMEGSQAEKVASMLVKTQDEGKTSVGELAQNMGRVIPVAAAYNVSLGTLTTAYAQLTKGGTNTAIATTNLTAMLNELAKDGSLVASVLQKKTGQSFAQLMASGKDLGGVMAILSDSVEGDATAFANLWSSTTAGQAALSLLNSGAEEFTRTLGIMENSSGAVEQNFQTMANTTEFAEQRMTTAAENLRIAIGDQLNPALEKLYDTGADAFTWATDFVNENPWVVSAVVGLTAAIGALAIGVAGLATASTAVHAFNSALTLLSANPIVLVTAAVAGLVTMIAAYEASANDASEDTKEFTQALKDSKTAYDDLMSAMGEQQADISSTAAALKGLLAVEDKSATQKEEIKRLIDQLNEAIPDLNLAYDAEKDALTDITEAEMDTMIARAQASEEHEAQMNRLADLRREGAEIADQLAEAEGRLTEAQAANNGEVQIWLDGAGGAYPATLDMGAEAVRRQQADVDALTDAYQANAAEIAALEAEADAYIQQQEEAARSTGLMETQVNELIARMEELEASYQKSYDEAYASITSQLGLFNELDGKAKTSIDNLIKTLEGQVAYMDDYAANIEKAMEMGLDEGLLAKLSDGSEESAQILDAIVQGGQEKVAELNEQLAKVEEGKAHFSDTVGAMKEDFDQKMAEITDSLKDTIEEMDLHDEAYKAGVNDIQGLIDGMESKRGEAIATAINLARDIHSAYLRESDQHSPSKKFAKAGANDVLGLIEGAEAKEAELTATYTELAMSALEGYKAAAAKGMAELQEIAATFKGLDSLFGAKADVGDLEYQLWERTDGKNVSDVEKYAKQLELLKQKQEDQEAVVKAAAAAYEAVVAQYGLGTEESYEYQKALLQEKLALQDLVDEIENVTNAKKKAAQEDFIKQAEMAWGSSGVGLAQTVAQDRGYITPYDVAEISGARLVTPDSYQKAVEDVLASRARHLPTTLDVPRPAETLGRQMEAMTAGMVNAISGAVQGGGAVREVVRLVTVDGKVLAEAAFDDFTDYGDANGTPIRNDRR